MRPPSQEVRERSRMEGVHLGPSRHVDLAGVRYFLDGVPYAPRLWQAIPSYPIGIFEPPGLRKRSGSPPGKTGATLAEGQAGLAGSYWQRLLGPFMVYEDWEEGQASLGGSYWRRVSPEWRRAVPGRGEGAPRAPQPWRGPLSVAAPQLRQSPQE
jgi:hypothetical protein